MTLSKRGLRPNETQRLADGPHGIFVLTGRVDLASGTVSGGEGGFASAGAITSETGADILQFRLSAKAEGGALLAEQFHWSGAEGVFRLDQVSFPPGARAYRHTHPGPGIRCLTDGELQIRSDHHTELMTPLSAWFEDAESPVRATAGDMPTAFVRAMVLPMEFLGKPTLNILDPADAAKPRLQRNRRFFDQVVRLPDG